MGDVYEVLRQIAEDLPPCRQCGEPHEYRQGSHGWTWGHPDDGHYYQRMPWPEFARQVLAEPR